MLHRKSTCLIIGALILLATIYVRISSDVRTPSGTPMVADMPEASSQAPATAVKIIKDIGSNQ